MIHSPEQAKEVRVLEGADPAVHVTAIERERPHPRLKTIGSSGARGTQAQEDRDLDKGGTLRRGLTLSPQKILELMEQLQLAPKLHEKTRGTHCSGLADESGMIITREDIGRHNTIDMLGGYMLLKDIEGFDKAVVTTGRISSEIVLKVRKMGIPVIVSHSAPTTRAISLCKELGMTLIGYVRDGKFRVYANVERIEV